MSTVETTQAVLTGERCVSRYTLECDVCAFARMLRSVAFAADTEAFQRYCIASVRLEIEPGKITAIATDGRHLAVATMECDTQIEAQLNLVIRHKPKKDEEKTDGRRGVRDLLKRFEGSKRGKLCVMWSTALELDPVDVHFAWHGTRGGKPKQVAIPTIPGRYPNWQAIIDGRKPAKGSIAGEVASLLTALPDPENRVCWMFDVADDTARVSHTAIELVSDDIRAYGSGLPTVRLDIERLREWLDTCNDESVANIFFADQESPIFAECDGATYALMPLAPPRN